MNQTHFGNGDNVGGDKNIRQNSPDFDLSGAEIGGGIAGKDYSGDVQNITQQIPESWQENNKELESLITKLIQAITEDAELDDQEKDEAVNKVETIVQASKKPEDQGLQKKAKRAVTRLETLAKGLEPAGKLARDCGKTLPVIRAFLGF